MFVPENEGLADSEVYFGNIELSSCMAVIFNAWSNQGSCVLVEAFDDNLAGEFFDTLKQ
jgi:hypothetical protein